jgi:carbon-monoxide dehydrogenase medium subunit
MMKLRLAEPAVLVDLRSVKGLDVIEESGDGLRIGALATHRSINETPVIGERYPLLHDASGGIGDAQIRNWGTIGGSVAHADPSSDWPAVLLATRATLVCRSLDGEREIAAADFFVDTFTTAIEPVEVLTEIRFPAPQAGSGGAYQKLERKAGDFASVGVAVQLRVDGGRISDAGIALTAVSDSPYAATEAEEAFNGQAPGEEAFRAAGAAAAERSRPTSDGHGPADYKRAMAAEMTVRALRLAVERATAR